MISFMPFDLDILAIRDNENILKPTKDHDLCCNEEIRNSEYDDDESEYNDYDDYDDYEEFLACQFLRENVYVFEDTGEMMVARDFDSEDEYGAYSDEESADEWDPVAPLT